MWKVHAGRAHPVNGWQVFQVTKDLGKSTIDTKKVVQLLPTFMQKM